MNDLARSAIMVCDLVLIPVQPSPYDIWAAEEIVKLIQEAAVFKPVLKSRFVINYSSRARRSVALKDYPFTVMKSAVSQRVAFAESAAGLSVLEWAPKGPASQDINAPVRELLACQPVRGA